jgi:hypothetical protein
VLCPGEARVSRAVDNTLGARPLRKRDRGQSGLRMRRESRRLALLLATPRKRTAVVEQHYKPLYHLALRTVGRFQGNSRLAPSIPPEPLRLK